MKTAITTVFVLSLLALTEADYVDLFKDDYFKRIYVHESRSSSAILFNACTVTVCTTPPHPLSGMIYQNMVKMERTPVYTSTLIKLQGQVRSVVDQNAEQEEALLPRELSTG
ncbi:hypothetical protein GN244_ATG19272 [Phytophthora infestans]|uniref:Secreted RxLR effector peptide protein n=1 Tax=Phytophthora infestans TaxID=4787 RepID=A0A833SV48_PHYIN|nr:hypothetical protein GN244_ATG19272 [Phytophthora infestans]